MILYCAADLIWATRIKATADSLGIPCRPARTVQMLEARLADSPVGAVIVDLEAGDAALEIVRALRGDGNEPGRDPDHRVFILAFGPHVDVAGFERVRQAGADRALARGAFDRDLPTILRELAGGTGTG